MRNPNNMAYREEAQWLACLPVKEGYKPKLQSFKDSCEKCGVQVWRANSSPRGMRVVCMDCFTKMLEQAESVTVMPPTPKQVEDIENHDK
jgi:formylmethanofuran dehydrogenase subunit E